VEGSSLTTSLRYQTFLFCNQRASARLVIRRAVEIESLQLVSCLWSIGLNWLEGGGKGRGGVVSGTLSSYGASAVARTSDRGRVAEV